MQIERMAMVYLHITGDQDLGEFVHDKPNGYGVYKHKNGASYEGLWSDKMQNEYDIENWNEGSCYQGEYQEGKKIGIG